MPLQAKKILISSAKWLGNVIAENLVGTILVSSSLLMILASFLSSVSAWLQRMLNTQPTQWSAISTAIVLIMFFLLSATLLFILRTTFIYFRTKSIWIEYGGFKWMVLVWEKRIRYMPYCLKCELELVSPEYSDSVFCPNCGNHWPLHYEKHKALQDSVESIASKKLQWHS
jgi:predicted RNA-binding Zn-ribbon protein involved in translation (DUF1610 family)